MIQAEVEAEACRRISGSGHVEVAEALLDEVRTAALSRWEGRIYAGPHAIPLSGHVRQYIVSGQRAARHEISGSGIRPDPQLPSSLILFVLEFDVPMCPVTERFVL